MAAEECIPEIFQWLSTSLWDKERNNNKKVRNFLLQPHKMPSTETN